MASFPCSDRITSVVLNVSRRLFLRCTLASMGAVAVAGAAGVELISRGVLPAGAVADFTNGGHDGSFFGAQEPPSLAFLARHIAG